MAKVATASQSQRCQTRTAAEATVIVKSSATVVPVLGAPTITRPEQRADDSECGDQL